MASTGWDSNPRGTRTYYTSPFCPLGSRQGPFFRRHQPWARRCGHPAPRPAAAPTPQSRPPRPPPSFPGGHCSASSRQGCRSLTREGVSEAAAGAEVGSRADVQTLTAQRSIPPGPKLRPLGFLDPSAQSESRASPSSQLTAAHGAPPTARGRDGRRRGRGWEQATRTRPRPQIPAIQAPQPPAPTAGFIGQSSFRGNLPRSSLRCIDVFHPVWYHFVPCSALATEHQALSTCFFRIS